MLRVVNCRAPGMLVRRDVMFGLLTARRAGARRGFAFGGADHFARLISRMASCCHAPVSQVSRHRGLAVNAFAGRLPHGRLPQGSGSFCVWRVWFQTGSDLKSLAYWRGLILPCGGLVRVLRAQVKLCPSSAPITAGFRCRMPDEVQFKP